MFKPKKQRSTLTYHPRKCKQAALREREEKKHYKSQARPRAQWHYFALKMNSTAPTIKLQENNMKTQINGKLKKEKNTYTERNV